MRHLRLAIYDLRALVFVCVSAFCVLPSAFSQSALTAEGLAAFIPPTSGGGGGGGGDDLTGISYRFVGDDVTGADGSSVATWPDSSGHHYDVFQTAGGQQPVVKVSVVNGHRAVQFDGSNDVLSTNVSPTVIGTATATAVFIVLKQTGSQAQNTPVAFNDASTDRFVVHATYNDVLYFDYENTTTARVNGNQPSGWDDNWHVVEVHRNGANMSILVDGTTVASRSDASGNFIQTGSNSLCVGAVNIAGGVAFKGQIAEVRGYAQDKDSTSSANIRAALKSTYGTP